MSSCSESTDSTYSEDFELDQNFQDSSIILVDTSLTTCDVSPFKSKGKTSKQKEIHAQKKVSQAAKNLNAAFMSSGINVACSSQAVISEKSMAETDMNQMMTELKQKFSKSNSYSEKIQLFTLKPQSWTIQKTTSYFETTTCMVKAA